MFVCYLHIVDVHVVIRNEYIKQDIYMYGEMYPYDCFVVSSIPG